MSVLPTQPNRADAGSTPMRVTGNQTTRDDSIVVNGLFWAHPSNEAYAAVKAATPAVPSPPERQLDEGEAGSLLDEPPGKSEMRPLLDELPGKYEMRPLLDEPLGPCHVLLHSNGSYYMVSTDGGCDALRHTGIRLWRSEDLQVWQPLGEVFNLDRDGSWCARSAIRFNLQTSLGEQFVYLQDEPGCEERAICSPRLYEIKGQTYIAFGMNYGGTGLLASVTGQPEGPYIEHAKITEDEQSASLFADTDGTFYYVCGKGAIARLSDDLTHVTEPFTNLQISDDYKAYTTVQRAVERQTIGVRGACLIKREGWYYLFCADRFYRMGAPAHDTFVAVSRHVKGPYSRRYLALPHCGEASPFADAEGRWYAARSVNDPYALYPDRFTLVPLHWGADRLVRPADGIRLENSPVARCRPLRWEEGSGNFIRDTQICPGPDGYYYMTGTTAASAAHAGIELWRSSTLNDFAYVGIVWRPEADETQWYNQLAQGAVRAFWAPEIHAIRNSFYITFSLQYGGTALLRSTSGQAAGPYEMIGQITDDCIDSSLFEDEDGTVYYVWQDGRIARMKHDLSGLAEPPRQLTDANGQLVGYEGVFIVSMEGRYVLGAAAWHGDIRVDGTYDMMVAVADQVYGPYGVRHLAVPHGGHGTILRAFDGRHYATLFGNDRTAPFRKRPGLVQVRLEGETVMAVDS